MSKGLRQFKKEDVRQVALQRTARSKENKAPKGLGYWGAHDYLRKHG